MLDNSPDADHLCGMDAQAHIKPTVKAVTSISRIPPDQWNACTDGDNPFVQHAFLAALEDSGSVGERTGWLPQHLVIEDLDGRVAACAPCYLKSHSYGEYVFDWGWANAYERAGRPYYPKLQCAVPFTPATGPRLMVRDDMPKGALRKLLIGALTAITDRYDASSAHITFIDEETDADCAAAGLLRRIGVQYHWKNEGYTCFDDFLGTLSSRKRKTLRKEREKARASGIELIELTGTELRPEHWDAFYQFYLSTIDRKWAQAYLNRAFFHRLGETLADRAVLLLGRKDGDYVCGALNLKGRTAIYGRYWGSTIPEAFLHFEACYYRAIDHAIAHGLQWVEAGAQGEHKIRRGYRPRITRSAHYVADPAFRAAVSEFLDRESRLVREEIELLAEELPFRKDPEPSSDRDVTAGAPDSCPDRRNRDDASSDPPARR